MQGGRPLAYESASFAPAEQNYTIGEQELLAVVFALRKWRTYLEGGAHPVRIVTDHLPLTYLPTKGTLGPRQVRWPEYLSRFNLEWVHTTGKNNIADVLSRMPCLAALVITRSRAQSQTQAGPAPKVSAPTPVADPPPPSASAEPETAERPARNSEPQLAEEDDFLDRVRAAYSTDAWLLNDANRRTLSSSVTCGGVKGSCMFLTYHPSGKSASHTSMTTLMRDMLA